MGYFLSYFIPCRDDHFFEEEEKEEDFMVDKPAVRQERSDTLVSKATEIKMDGGGDVDDDFMIEDEIPPTPQVDILDGEQVSPQQHHQSLLNDEQEKTPVRTSSSACSSRKRVKNGSGCDEVGNSSFMGGVDNSSSPLFPDTTVVVLPTKKKTAVATVKDDLGGSGKENVPVVAPVVVADDDDTVSTNNVTDPSTPLIHSPDIRGQETSSAYGKRTTVPFLLSDHVEKSLNHMTANVSACVLAVYSDIDSVFFVEACSQSQGTLLDTHHQHPKSLYDSIPRWPIRDAKNSIVVVE